MSGYWAGSLLANLSQGDVVAAVHSGTSTSPVKPLVAGATLKGGAAQWITGDWSPDGNGLGHFLARGRNLPSIVLSYSCDIDKSKKGEPVSIAPVFPLANAGDETFRQYVRERKRFPFFPLPAIPGILTESYVDFRCITYVQAGVLTQSDRIGSPTEEGLTELTEHLVGFFTRLRIPKTLENA